MTGNDYCSPSSQPSMHLFSPSMPLSGIMFTCSKCAPPSGKRTTAKKGDVKDRITPMSCSPSQLLLTAQILPPACFALLPLPVSACNKLCFRGGRREKVIMAPNHASDFRPQQWSEIAMLDLMKPCYHSLQNHSIATNVSSA